MTLLLILDWEEMINEPRLDMYSLNYDDANHTGTCEFNTSLLGNEIFVRDIYVA